MQSNERMRSLWGSEMLDNCKGIVRLVGIISVEKLFFGVISKSRDVLCVISDK